MEDEYDYDAHLDDTVVLDSPVSESRLLNLDFNTEVLDVCESENSRDEMEDHCEKEVVLDSDEEGGDENRVNLLNGEPNPVIGRLSGRKSIGLLKRQKVQAGHFRRVDKKFSKRVFLQIDSAKSDSSNEERNGGSTCLYNDGRFQDHLAVMDSLLSSSPDKKPVPMNAKEILEDPEYRNMVREKLREDSHESRSMDMGKDSNFACVKELNYAESQEPSEPHDKALEFVDQYLSVSDLGSYKGLETGNTKRIISPPSYWSKGSQRLARRVNLGCASSNLMTFHWAEKQIEKSEYTSPRKKSVFEFKGDKSGYVSFNQVSDNAKLQKEISNLPGNMLYSGDVDTKSLNSNDMDKISGTCKAYDSKELDKQLNAEKGEELRLSPDALDIGLDTQIAAEAMEALIEAVPPIFDACFANQDSDNALLDSSNTVNKKNNPEHLVNHEEAFVGWRCKGKRSKCMKVSTVQGKDISCLSSKLYKNQRGIVAQLPVSKYPMSRKDLEFERESLKELQKVQCFYRRRAKETSPKPRKIIRGINLELNSNSSSIVKTDTSQYSNPNVAVRTLSKSNMWIFPKGKRTSKCAARHSIENNVEKHPLVNVEVEKSGQKLLVYARRSKSSLQGKLIGNSSQFGGDSSSPLVNDNAISDKQVQISTEFDTVKPHARSSLVKELIRLGYAESLPDFLPKDKRKRRAMQKVCVLFSQNLEKSILNQQRKIVKRLGFSTSSCCSNATHFVTDRFMRTRNMLEAIALGKPVVTHLWLESCEQAGYVIDEKSYILRDERKEKEIGFNMLVSLGRASQHPLLKGREVLVTPNVKPGLDMINDLVKAVQGQAVQRILNTNMKDKAIPDDVLILSSEKDYTICLPFLEKGASVYDSELLLNGIVTQKLEYDKFRLFKDLPKNGF